MVQILTQFNDTLTLGDETVPAQDTVIGLDASDILTSDDSVGGSVLFGNRDNDSLTSRSAGNILYGGQENDQLLSLNSGGSVFFGDLGDDLFNAYGGTGKDTVYGGTSDGNQSDGGDVFNFGNASGGSNLGYGNTGDDFLSGSGFGSDTLYGGKGDDTIQVVEVSGSAGGTNTGFAPQNTSLGNINISTTTTGTGTGDGVGVVTTTGANPPDNPGKNYLSGDLGKDLIYGLGDRDSLFGGDDEDSLVLLGNIADTAANPNNNTQDSTTGLTGVPQNAYLEGGNGADSIKAYGGLRGRNTLKGGEGDDTIKNYGVQSYLEGGTGNDTLILENSQTNTEVYGRNTVFGGEGGDSVNASESGGTNLLWGDAGDDTLIGSNPDVATDANAPGDTLYGDDSTGEEEGNDSLTGGNNSLMFGQKGNDSLIARGFTVADDGTVTESEVSNATLYGGQGTDSLLAKADNAVKSSYLSGDLGNDTLVTDAAAADDTETNTLEGGEGNDSLYGVGGSFNSLSGGAGGDILQAGLLGDGGATGAGNSNTLSGGAGNDTLVAGNTGDSLVGGADNDWFFGTTGDDTLGYYDANNDREGSDTLYGGQGADSLIGTSGFDGFYYSDNDEIQDIITSFETGTDKIYLKSTAFGNSDGNLAGGAGNQLRDGLDFESIGTGDAYTSLGGTFSGGTTAPAIVFDANSSGGGTLYWDWTGGGNTDAVADLTAIATIESGSVRASDIELF